MSNNRTMEEQIKSHIKEILSLIGENPERDGLKETPNRVARMYETIFSGYKTDPESVFKLFDSDGYEGIILVKDIEFYSHCEHHMVPFYGVVHIAYIPNKKIIGLSKLARLVEVYARRLQVQERLTKEINDAMQKYMQPKGVAVLVEAKHMCMCMRGIQKQSAKTVTTSFSGEFVTNLYNKEDFFKQVYSK